VFGWLVGSEIGGWWMIIGGEHAPKTTMNRTQDTKESEHWLVAVKQ
jgi:hypothetical protein